MARAGHARRRRTGLSAKLGADGMGQRDGVRLDGFNGASHGYAELNREVMRAGPNHQTATCDRSRGAADWRADAYRPSAGGRSVSQTLPLCSPKLNTILSRATEMSGAPRYRLRHDRPLLWKC
jgi:hypothetical protein